MSCLATVPRWPGPILHLRQLAFRGDSDSGDSKLELAPQSTKSDTAASCPAARCSGSAPAMVAAAMMRVSTVLSARACPPPTGSAGPYSTTAWPGVTARCGRWKTKRRAAPEPRSAPAEGCASSAAASTSSTSHHPVAAAPVLECGRQWVGGSQGGGSAYQAATGCSELCSGSAARRSLAAPLAAGRLATPT